MTRTRTRLAGQALIRMERHPGLTLAFYPDYVRSVEQVAISGGVRRSRVADGLMSLMEYLPEGRGDAHDALIVAFAYLTLN